MNNRERDSLDRHITGNYGEDQFATCDIRTLQCDMARDCTRPVTHIGSKGYAYCRVHGLERRQSGYEHTREMRQWEIQRLESGLTLASYAPGANHEKP